MKRFAIAAVLCALCIGGAIAVSARGGGEACEDKGGTMTSDGKCTLAVDAKVNIDYPLALSQNGVVAQMIDPFIQLTKAHFFQTVGQAMFPASGPYELDITYDTVTHSADIVTLLFNVSELTGGAGPSTSLVTYTFDTQNNKVLTLNDLFTNTTDALNIIAPLAQAAITQNLGGTTDALMLQQGTAIDPKNYAAFSLDADSITFYFQEFQVAPGAAGIQTVTIPLSQLSSVLSSDFAS